MCAIEWFLLQYVVRKRVTCLSREILKCAQTSCSCFCTQQYTSLEDNSATSVFSFCSPCLRGTHRHYTRPAHCQQTDHHRRSRVILDAFSNPSQVDVIYTNFAKVQVLRATGFGEPLLSCFESFVTGRKQFVKLNGVFEYG